MKIDVKLLSGLFCMAISLFVVLCNLTLIEDAPVYRLSLTTEGCAYAQSIDLPVVNNNGPCSVVVRYLPHAISSGGVLHLNDDKKVSITDTMLLATAKLDTKLPLTPAQRDRWKWVYVWLCVAIMAGCTTFIYWIMKKK